jgi:hypothetical protein
MAILPSNSFHQDFIKIMKYPFSQRSLLLFQSHSIASSNIAIAERRKSQFHGFTWTIIWSIDEKSWKETSPWKKMWRVQFIQRRVLLNTSMIKSSIGWSSKISFSIFYKNWLNFWLDRRKSCPWSPPPTNLQCIYSFIDVHPRMVLFWLCRRIFPYCQNSCSKFQQRHIPIYSIVIKS